MATIAPKIEPGCNRAWIKQKHARKLRARLARRGVKPDPEQTVNDQQIACNPETTQVQARQSWLPSPKPSGFCGVIILPEPQSPFI